MRDRANNAVEDFGSTTIVKDNLHAFAEADRVSVKYDLEGVIIEHWDDQNLEIWVTTGL